MNRRDALVLFSAALACSKRGAADIRVVQLADVQKRLADAKKASKIAVAHFWATWCGPCIEEFPALARMHLRIADEPRIDFFAIAVAEEDPLAVKRFVEESGAKFPVFIADTDDAEAFTDAIDPQWRGFLPSTFVYDRAGEIVMRYIGPVEDTRELEAKLRELAKS